MASTNKMTSISVSRDQRRRRRLNNRSMAMRLSIAAMALPTVIVSHTACRDSTITNSASSTIFVTGFSVPSVRRIKTHTIHFGISTNCKRRRQNPIESRLHPSLRALHSSSCEIHKRESLCTLRANSLTEEEDSSSTIVFPEATRSLNSELLSQENRNVDEIDPKVLLMNPMEDFATEEETLTKSMTLDGNSEYQKGLLTIGFITLLFATNSPVLHWAFTSGDNHPPVLLVNAAVSIVALVGLLLGGDTLEDSGSLPIDGNDQKPKQATPGWLGGLELGLWKFLGTTSNLYGLALTTAGHGALLIQLTTLIVPTTRALFYKESISNKLKLSIGLALSGVVCFANDPTGTPSLLGDGLCVLAAVCYLAYDLRLYEYGKVVDAVKPLITTKIFVQALLSFGLLFLSPSSSLLSEDSTAATISSWQESSDYLQTLLASSEWLPVVLAVIWSGVAVNAVAPFLQVGGQQIVGPTKCQTIYASQPLWAAILSFVFLGERLGISGVVGGTAFLVALALAATAESAATPMNTDSETAATTS